MPAPLRTPAEATTGDGSGPGVLALTVHDLHRARVALAGTDPYQAAADGLALLVGIEDRLAEDHTGGAPRLRALVGGYALAAATLLGTGVAPGVVIELLRRGTAEAERAIAMRAGAPPAA